MIYKSDLLFSAFPWLLILVVLIHIFALYISISNWNKQCFSSFFLRNELVYQVWTIFHPFMRSDLQNYHLFFYRQGTNACSNKPCSHICVPLPGEKFTCLCPDGLKAINNTADGKISCKCTDGSDELADGTCAQQDGTCRYVCL